MVNRHGGRETAAEESESVREATGYGEAWRATLAYWLESGLLYRSGETLEFGHERIRTALPASHRNRQPHPEPDKQPSPQLVAPAVASLPQPPTATSQQVFLQPVGERLLPLPTALPEAERLPSLQQLADTVAACRQCRLAETRSQTVFGVGSTLAEVVFVGEGPGADEDLQGEPFVGPAGKLLDQMIKAIGRQRADVYIANVVKCRPPGNRNPEPHEVAACQSYLFRQLEIIQPKVIFCLGKFAILCLTGHGGTVGQARNQSFLWRSIPVIASFHPAYYLRTPSRRRSAWEDLLRLLHHLDH